MLKLNSVKSINDLPPFAETNDLMLITDTGDVYCYSDEHNAWNLITETKNILATNTLLLDDLYKLKEMGFIN